ncbi:AAA-ATPase ASD, mitochondrial [Ziziphus jujuba]|uniref:AAA-ATPase ASD, mitochondrial n=1 Tax=Ziziphus jujuba TaxID=326968 RepID=A0ABM3IGG6_ZIZJJ|nr:AAA-ATPase ASD, mitochondrial [Ziziphus jujuba]
MVGMGALWSQVGSTLASFMFIYAIVKEYFPYQFRGYLEIYSNKLVGYVYPYIQITFHEHTGERFKRSEVYANIRTYLSASPSSSRAKRLKAHDIKDNKSLVLSMDDNEAITEEFHGVKLWWTSCKYVSKAASFSFYPASDERRYYTLTFHKRHRDLITSSYLNHVIKEGKAISIRNRQVKLYTNNSSDNWYGYKRTKWSHIVFEHPASFNTIAMDPKKKEEIINDLDMFKQGKNYYAKIGKAWKRGYLLYGPPGTGKSSMIAAMANYLEYDIYDLELTSVKNNTDLRKLLIDTPNKSIIVIEDIDCSLDLTGQRKKKKKEKDEEDEEKDPIRKKAEEEEATKSKVTLSGLLNVIDGIWSACGGERVFVFTTNYVEKLDPALIRRGRMDKHIVLSYCRFEAFKVLAGNYLDIESHHLFSKIKCLLEETDMTPADVAENLMPKSLNEDAEICLKKLIEALEVAKEEARKKAEEDARLKAEEEEAKLKENMKEEKEEKDVKCNGTLAEDVKQN